MPQKIFTTWNLVVLMAMFLFACQEDLENQVKPDITLEVEKISFELIPDQYIVVFNTEKTGEASARYSDPIQARQLVKDRALDIVKSVVPAFTEKQLSRIYSATINGAVVRLPGDKIEALRKDERIAYVEQDRIITMAPPWERGDDGGSSGQEVPYGITRVNGGATYSGDNVAWIIDTGIDLDHPDLDVIPENPEGGSTTFVSTGKDATTADDFNGHGTHVAGTIAAIDNTEGVIGVAAGAKVVAVKVLDRRGSGTYSGVIAGVDYVGGWGQAGDVANMSLGGSYSESLNLAVEAASSNGIYFTVAAGNDSKDANNYSPASANGTNIFTISAMDVNDQWASFSNYANPPVDYCAPGVSVYSTYKDGSYKSLSGTSMAAPHAAGVLLLGNASADGTVNGDPDEVKDPIIYHCSTCNTTSSN